LLIRLSKYSVNTLLQTAFSVILPTWLNDNEFKIEEKRLKDV